MDARADADGLGFAQDRLMNRGILVLHIILVEDVAGEDEQRPMIGFITDLAIHDRAAADLVLALILTDAGEDRRTVIGVEIGDEARPELRIDAARQGPARRIGELGVGEVNRAGRPCGQDEIGEFGADMAEDIIAFKLLPEMLNPAVVLQVSNLISRNLFQLSLDYIGQPERQAAICALAEEQIVMLFTGASVLQSLGQLKLPVE